MVAPVCHFAGAIVAETRRQLFKTSVLSGLGLMSATMVAGCSTPITGESGPYEDGSIIVGYTGSIWYIFKPDGNKSKYKVYSTPYSAIMPSNAPFDTQRFYDKAFADGRLEPVISEFFIGLDKYTFDANSPYLDSRSEILLTQRTGNYAVKGRWNEVGHQ